MSFIFFDLPAMVLVEFFLKKKHFTKSDTVTKEKHFPFFVFSLKIGLIDNCFFYIIVLLSQIMHMSFYVMKIMSVI